ncbi:MAG TPA: protein kinase [Kofleriaceae bacterium]|nr:protein kinase [Kofleriaceae bacterium]
MAGCITDDDLFELASARRQLGDAPVLEAHLADCPACSALLCLLLAAPRDDARRELTGTTLGPYRLDGLIGAGAMGEVYRGWDARLARNVAVKVLSRQFAESPERVRRLEAEARAAAAIAHPNVVTIYDTGTHDGVPFVVSELCVGESLRSVIDRAPVPAGRAASLGLQLARGVGAAHAQGVVHRDLKPGNLIVTDDGTLKILDFGLAKVSGDGDADATEPGTLLGTAGYLSPEQARGEPADARSDLFSVGAILYELLSGRRAFGGATFAERLSGVLRDTPAPIDGAIGPIVMRCLEKDPRKRFQSANDLAWVLEAQLGAAPPARPDRARGISRRTFVLGTAATGIGGGVLGRALAPDRGRAFVPELRQLTFRQGRVASARFTPDGGSLLYSAAWEEHAMAVFTARLGGGGTRPLELPPAQLLAVSSRGELALSLDHRFFEGFHQRGHLALAPLEGGEPRGLGIDVQHADFSPDGAELAIVRRAGARFRLELPIGRVLLEGGWLSHPRIFPDGELVACCVHDSPQDDRGDLVLVPRRGGAARAIATGWSSIDGLAWTPSGHAMWISASRKGGNNSVWAIARDGRDLSRVPSVGRVRVHDVAADGRLAVTQTSGRVRTMVKAPGATAEVDLGLSDLAMVSDISGDGRFVVIGEFGDVDTAYGAYLRPTDGGPALRLGEGLPIDLADDGRGVLAWLYKPAPTIAVFPVPEGQPRPLAFPGLTGLRSPRWCAGDRIVVIGAAAGRPARLWRLDPDQTLVPISDEAVFGYIVVSPDGRSIALNTGERLLVIDADLRAPSRVVPGTFVDEVVCGWSADGTEVFVRSLSPPIRIRRVNLATAASTLVREVAPPRLGLRGVEKLVMSQAGDAYAYSYGQELSRLYSMTTEDPRA